MQGLRLIEQEPFVDERGLFSRLYCRQTLAAAGIDKPIAQMNQSVTRAAGCLRGLHFQHPPACETKIVICLAGAVFDVAVDLRRGSPTFLHWHGETLSAENKRILVIPEGFAHGFQAVMPDSLLLYLHTEPYARESEGRIRFDDPALGIRWPLPVTGISDQDMAAAHLTPSFSGICP
jgi:dTDP-4-dehydrorhamnose 3,5-epimerase